METGMIMDAVQSEKESVQASLETALGASPSHIQYMMPQRPKQQVRKHSKIGRNDKCPCGSEKKYKHCCLATGTYEGYQNAV